MTLDIIKLKKFIKTNIVLILLLLFVFGGGFLRFYHLSSQSYWMDEGYTINAVTAISEHHSTILDSGQNYLCLIYCYPTSLLVKFFGSNPIGYRLLATIAGLIFIPLIFFITKRMFDKKIGLLSSFFVAFSYWQIAWSRQARVYTLFSVFFWLAIYFFYQILTTEKRKTINIIGLIFSSVVTILAHSLGYLLPIIFLIWFIVDYVIKKRNTIKIKYLVTILAIFFAIIILSYSNGILILIKNLEPGYILPYYLNFYLRTYWLFIPLLIIAWLSPHKNKKEILLLTFIFCSYLLFLSFASKIVHYRYLFHLTPFFYILGAIGMIRVYDKINQKIFRNIFLVTVISIFLASHHSVLWPKENYFLESDNPQKLNSRPFYSYTPQPDWSESYAFIKERKKNNEIIISSQPVFNKIFLNEAGYWIKYNYLGQNDKTEFSKDGRELYVSAKILNNLQEVKKITSDNQGFLIIDFMSIDNRIDKNILNYINSLELVFHKKTNFCSEVWVYRF